MGPRYVKTEVYADAGEATEQGRGRATSWEGAWRAALDRAPPAQACKLNASLRSARRTHEPRVDRASPACRAPLGELVNNEDPARPGTSVLATFWVESAASEVFAVGVVFAHFPAGGSSFISTQ